MRNVPVDPHVSEWNEEPSPVSLEKIDEQNKANHTVREHCPGYICA